MEYGVLSHLDAGQKLVYGLWFTLKGLGIFLLSHLDTVDKLADNDATELLGQVLGVLLVSLIRGCRGLRVEVWSLESRA